MKNIKFILFLSFVILQLLLLVGVAIAQDGWEVNVISPTPIGPQVAIGIDSPANPDTIWTVTEDGVLQFIAKDHDPKCHQFPGYVQVEETPYPIPTSPPQPGKDCAVTVNNLFHSRLFTVSQGSEVWGEQGSSGSFVFNFATNTPTPTSTATTTPTATFTPVPPDTATPTATITNTVKPPETVEPPATATSTPLPVAGCLDAHAEKQPDGSYLVFVNAVNASGYTLFDGKSYLYFEDQPIAMSNLETGIFYTVSVGSDNSLCSFRLEPTGLPTDEQPRQLNFQLVLPFLSN